MTYIFKEMENGIAEAYSWDFMGKNALADSFREVADELCVKHGFDLDTQNILFLMDRTGRKNLYSGSAIEKVPQAWKEILYQFTGYRFDYAIKIWEKNLESLNSNQASGLLYHELRHLIRNPETGRMDFKPYHDLEDWKELARFGDWEFEENSGLPNLMEEGLGGDVKCLA